MDFLKILLPIYNKSVKAHSLAELQTLEIFSASIGIAYNEKKRSYKFFLIFLKSENCTLESVHCYKFSLLRKQKNNLRLAWQLDQSNPELHEYSLSVSEMFSQTFIIIEETWLKPDFQSSSIRPTLEYCRHQPRLTTTNFHFILFHSIFYERTCNCQ